MLNTGEPSGPEPQNSALKIKNKKRTDSYSTAIDHTISSAECTLSENEQKT